MARKHREKPNTGEWLNTYADMVTLLLTFFVLLFSMSSVDAQKWEIVVESFTRRGDKPSQIVMEDLLSEGDKLAGSSGGLEGLGNSDVLPEEFDMLFKYIQDYVAAADMQDSVSVESGEGFVFIRFRDNVFFNPDSATIKNEGKELLGYVGEGMKNVQDQIKVIKIDGHTAAVEDIPNYPVDDRKLSEDRAGNVLRFFEDTVLIREDKLVSTGYGKYRPIADNKTPEGRSQNRRVEILIVKNDAEGGTSDELNQLLNGLLDSEEFIVDKNVQP